MQQGAEPMFNGNEQKFKIPWLTDEIRDKNFIKMMASNTEFYHSFTVAHHYIGARFRSSQIEQGTGCDGIKLGKSSYR